MMTRRVTISPRGRFQPKRRLRKVSKTRQAGRATWDAEYAKVDARSGGFCEVLTWKMGMTIAGPTAYYVKCTRKARDHHHLVKPRASHHTAKIIVHICRDHHEQVDLPFAKGRLILTPNFGRFEGRIVTAPSKQAARALGLIP